MTDVIDIFSKSKLSEKEAQANAPKWSWEREVHNLRTIQAGFAHLDAHTKNVALDAIVENYIMLIEAVFKENYVEKEEE